LLAGCASTQSNTPDSPAANAMTPGMVMPDGSTMGAAAPRHFALPSAAARMICANETRADVASVLKLTKGLTATPRWDGHTYFCTYALPAGRFVLSVHESSSPAAAVAYARSSRARLGRTTALAGLTDVAFGTAAGDVVLVKDNDTLHVDATALPAEFGSEQEKRADFAYEIASDILGCWTGDDGS
jgi:hypothetical protein